MLELNVRFTTSKVFVDGDLEVEGGNSKLGNIRIENNIIASLAGADNKYSLTHIQMD